MKLPQKNTRLMIVLDALRAHGPYSLAEGIAHHGDFKMKHAGVANMYDQLITAGCAQRDGLQYKLSRAAERHFNPPASANMGDVVPARPSIDVFSVPALDLSKYGITPLGMRPGSNDYREWPSVNAPFSKPLGS